MIGEMASFYGLPADELLDRSPERLGICYVAWAAARRQRAVQAVKLKAQPVATIGSF